MNEIFAPENFRSELIWKRFTGTKIQYKSFPIVTDTIYLYTKSDQYLYKPQFQPYSEKYLKTQFRYEDERGKYLLRNFYSPGDGPARWFFGKLIPPPKGHHWRMTQEKIDQLIREGRIVLDKQGFPKLKMYLHEMPGNPYSNLLTEFHVVQGSSEEFWNFPTQNPESLIKVLIESTSNEGDVVMDFFLGSGTTCAVAHKLKRKWIGVEMGEHFWTVVMPRMKKVLFYDKSGISKEKDVKEKYNEKNAGGFFKYQILEQYEDALDNIELKENREAMELFKDEYLLKYFLDFETRENPYLLNIDLLKNPFKYKLKVNLKEVGEPEEMIIDIPETFNYLLGLKVKKIKYRKNDYLFILGEKEGKSYTMVWRDWSEKWSDEEYIKDREFIKQELKEWKPQVVYINGQNILTPNFGDFQIELRCTETEFKKLMER
jgi:adenine-specific DNA-methyltransferase